MKQINLYQTEFRPPKIILPAREMAISGVVFLLGLLALYAWNGWQLKQLRQQVEQVEQRADAVARQIAASAPGARQADPNLALEAQSLEARVHALQQAQDAIAGGELGSETGYSAQFRALARTAGSGAWLTGVTIADGGRAMDLRGRARSGSEPARLIAGLRREPLLVGLSFAVLDVHPPVDAAAAANASLPPAGQAGRSLEPRYLEFSLQARLPEAAAPNSLSAVKPGTP
ncbi:MAG: hypothetical protein Q8O79_06880 [Pseudomonadota bacterium]|nr:hypothetical protein [Pseudomonadota bacterium]